jgi:hypothetical protein
MAYGTINADLMTTSDGVSSSGLYGFKNRLINSAMVIDQRNAGASITPTDGQYTVDRWKYGASQASKFTFQQNAGSLTGTNLPAGFVNYAGLTVASAVTIGATDYFTYNQFIEGYNIADLNWGNANAKTVTLSFWVRSSLTGTFGVSFTNNAENRFYPATYTILSANTWEQKTITVAGDTSGTWLTTNGAGIRLIFGLGVGSSYSASSGAWTASAGYGATGATSVVGTNGATFYITGVQLEKGSTATSFDYRPFGTELQLCQRYYENNYSTGYAVGSAASYPYNVGQFINGYTSSSGQKFQTANLLVQKRTAQPTNTFYDAAGNSGKISTLDSGGTDTNNVSIGVNFISDKYIAAGPSSGTMTGSRYFWTCSAEL